MSELNVPPRTNFLTLLLPVELGLRTGVLVYEVR